MVKKIMLAVVMIIALMLVAGCGGDSQETPSNGPAKEAVSNEQEKELNEAEKIEKVIRDRIDEGEYRSTKLDRITVNENLGTEEGGDYIALVYLKFDIKNTKNTGNKMMRMYSDDLVAAMASKGITNVCEAAVFWEDEYNDRNLKYTYEYRNGGFYITDIAGE